MITVEQLATELNVSPKTVYRRWQEWGLKAYRIGGSLRFRRAEVTAWVNARAL